MNWSLASHLPDSSFLQVGQQTELAIRFKSKAWIHSDDRQPAAGRSGNPFARDFILPLADLIRFGARARRAVPL